MSGNLMPSCDLLCIGNAIVDMLAEVEPSVITELGAVPGSMMLIDAAKMQQIQQQIQVKQVAGGGSAANTAVVAARMGINVSYLGKVSSDEAGKEFALDLQKQGIDFLSRPLEDSVIPTARCIVLVTPDGQRTMFTYLGACAEFSSQDVSESVVAKAEISYLEGYLFDKPQAQEAFYCAAYCAHQAGRKVALSLSDVFCIQRHHAAFRSLVAGEVDILFANEAEILALYETGHVEEALRCVAQETALSVITRGEKGAVVVAGHERHDVLATPVSVVDTTGAGDAFAAGFLAGYRRGRTLPDSVQLGNQAAGAVITRLGARPDMTFSLKA